MSLYNTLFGVNENEEILLKILSVDKDFFERYRDIELIDSGTKIRVLTRTGGNNRKDYSDNWTKIRTNKLYISDYDDEFDETYAYIEFEVPKEYLEVTKSFFKGEPKTIKEKFDDEIKEMGNPNSSAHKRAEMIAKKIENALESDKTINIIRF